MEMETRDSEMGIGKNFSEQSEARGCCGSFWLLETVRRARGRVWNCGAVGCGDKWL